MREAQSQLDVSYEKLFRELVDVYRDGLAVFDEDACLIHCNPALRELNPGLGDLLRQGLEWDRMLMEMVARGSLDATARDRLRGLEAQLDAGLDALVKLDLGERGIHQFSLTGIPSSGFIMVQRDVTRRELAEEQDREADALLRQVLEACPANLVMSRIDDGQIIYRSPAAREMLGPAKKVGEHFISSAEQADLVTALLPEGRVDDMSATIQSVEGEIFPALISARVIEYRGEDVVVSSVVDITKEVEMRKMLGAQRERIFEVEKLSALGELLAGVAHELNNPLSVVVGHSLMMREETTDPDVLRRVEQIADAAERCTKIVKAFLAMAREQDVEKQPLALDRIVAGACHSLEEAGRTSNLQIEADLSDDLPQVYGDAGQLEQVFMNLMANAEQAFGGVGRSGRLTITAQPDRLRSLMQIDVQDDGPGIPKRIGRKVFEPLFTTKEVGQGTGIGLAFCHRVLTAHGGSIELVPSEKGAHFRIHLPLADAAQGGEARSAPHQKSASQGHVLVIDDEEDVAGLIAEILRRDGFTAEEVHSGEEGLEAVLARSFDAILADIKMPGIGGQGFVEEVRRQRPDLVERIAFVTGSTMSPDTRGFLDNCEALYLEKPVAPGEVRALARELVQRSKGSE